MRSRWLCMALLVLAAGCSRGGLHSGTGPEDLAQRRETSLVRLAHAAGHGSFIPFRSALVALDQDFIQDLVRAALPLDYGVGGQFRMNIDSVHVELEDGLPLVQLGGSVRAQGAALVDAFARVNFDTELEVVAFDPEQHTLRCQLKLLDSRVTALGPKGASHRWVEQLGKFGLDALGPSAVAFQIPIKIQPQIKLPEVGPEGEVRIQPAFVPLKIDVGEVTAYRERLWVAIGVAVAGSKEADSLPKAAKGKLKPTSGPAALLAKLKNVIRPKSRIAALRDTLDTRVARDSLLLPIVRDGGDVVLAVRQGIVRQLLAEATQRYLKRVELDIDGDLETHAQGELHTKTPLGRVHAGDWRVHLQIRKIHGVLRANPPQLTVGAGNRVHMVIPAEIQEGVGSVTVNFEWDPHGLTSVVCRGFKTRQVLQGSIRPFTYNVLSDFDFYARGGAIVAEPVRTREKFPLHLEPSADSWARIRAALEGENRLFRCGLLMKPDETVAKLRKLAAAGIKIRLPKALFRPMEFPASLTKSVVSGGRLVEISATPNQLRVTPQAFWYSARVTLSRAPLPGGEAAVIPGAP